MKKNKKVANIAVKREPKKLTKATKTDQLDAREVIKKGTQGDRDNKEADQIMSETDHVMIMPEATEVNQNETPPELKPNILKIQLPKVADSKAPTKNDLKEMRQFLQENRNLSQIQIASAESIAQNLEIEETENNFEANTQSNDFHVSQKILAAQCKYYRNTEIRAQQKHLAELRNLEIQHQILEIELKIKQRELNKNTNKC